MALLDNANIANAGVNSVSEFLTHPVLTERERWRDVQIPGATVQALLPPANLAGIDPRMDPIPAAGQHTDDILTALGHSAADIDRLHAEGAI
jgi:formyl-CoA transferase